MYIGDGEEEGHSLLSNGIQVCPCMVYPVETVGWVGSYWRPVYMRIKVLLGENSF